jgi:hypothetical protein
MHDELNQHDRRMFDRLVDGELSADERRRLLTSLDDRPEGWRQCALAFLEAQAWRTELSQAAQETASTPAALTLRGEVAATTHRTGRYAARWLVIAAALVVAFGLGVFWPADHDESTIAEFGPASPDQPAGGAAPLETTPSPNRASRDALVFFVNDDAGGTQRVHVPLVDAGTVDRQLGVRFRSGVPAAIRDHLRQNGYDVHSQRRYAPLRMENGGSLVVPVEDTRIVPVSPVVF